MTSVLLLWLIIYWVFQFFVKKPPLIFTEHHIFAAFVSPLETWNFFMEMDVKKAIPFIKGCFICSKNILLGFFFFPPRPLLVSLTTMNKTLLLCAGFLWNDLAQVCSLNVLPRSSPTIWSYNNWMFAQGEISWQVIFPPQQYHLQLFPYIQCHWKVCPSERLWMVCFHFQHSNFHLEVKVRSNPVLVKYHNIQFHSRFRECFITFLNQMSSWSKRENWGIFNVSPDFILEQINLLILQREVGARKATQALVLVCQWHQSAREVKTAGAQSWRCYSGKDSSVLH